MISISNLKEVCGERLYLLDSPAWRMQEEAVIAYTWAPRNSSGSGPLGEGWHLKSRAWSKQTFFSHLVHWLLPIGSCPSHLVSCCSWADVLSQCPTFQWLHFPVRRTSELPSPGWLLPAFTSLSPGYPLHFTSSLSQEDALSVV